VWQLGAVGSHANVCGNIRQQCSGGKQLTVIGQHDSTVFVFGRAKGADPLQGKKTNAEILKDAGL
jgi:hypothetical protein